MSTAPYHTDELPQVIAWLMDEAAESEAYVAAVTGDDSLGSDKAVEFRRLAATLERLHRDSIPRRSLK